MSTPFVAGTRKRPEPTRCPRCDRLVNLGDGDLCGACCDSDVADMRNELSALPELERRAALEDALRAAAVWQGAANKIDRRPPLASIEASGRKLGYDPTRWPSVLIGLAWAAAQ